MQRSIYKNISLKLLVIFFTILNIDNIYITNNIRLLPNLDIMLIFFFTVYRTGSLPIWFIFIIGVLVDSLNGTSIGLSSLIYILLIKIFSFFNYQEKNINDFKKNITQFGLFLGVFSFLKLGFLSIQNLQFYNIYNFIIEFVMSMIIYTFINFTIIQYNKNNLRDL
jgi:cell shape-determining protein MreD